MHARLLLFAALMLGAVLPAPAGGQERDGQSEPFYARLTPYVHHDFCAAVVIHPRRITQSSLGKSIALNGLITAALQQTELDARRVLQLADPAKIRRLTVLVDPFPGGNIAFFPAVVVEFREDTPGREVLRALWPASQPSADDQRLFVGLETMAQTSIDAYIAGPRTILIAPEPTLRKMRSTYRRASQPLRAQLDRDFVESEIVVEYASQPALRKLIELTGLAKSQLRDDPETDEAAKTMLIDVRSVSLHLQLRKEQSIQASIRCDSRGSAAKVKGMLGGGLEMLAAAIGTEEFKNELKKEQVPPPVVELLSSRVLKDVARAAKLEQRGDSVEVKLEIPQAALDLARRSAAPLAGPEPVHDKGQWVVIFRSADPAIWNSDVSEGRDRYAMRLSRVPDGIRYVRLQIDSQRSVIMEVTKDELGKRVERGRFGWVGNNHFQWNGRHLGMYDKRWTDQVRGTIQIWPLSNRGIRGWGFGNRTRIDDRQGYSWAGKSLPKTVFEIAVKSGSLTAAERKALLK